MNTGQGGFLIEEHFDYGEQRTGEQSKSSFPTGKDFAAANIALDIVELFNQSEIPTLEEVEPLAKKLLMSLDGSELSGSGAYKSLADWVNASNARVWNIKDAAKQLADLVIATEPTTKDSNNTPF